MAIQDLVASRRLPAVPFGLGMLDILAAGALVPFLLLDVAIAAQADWVGVAPLAVSAGSMVAVLLRRRFALAGVVVVSTACLGVTAVAAAGHAQADPEVVVPLALAYLLIPIVRHRSVPIAAGACALALVAVTLASTARDHHLAPPLLLVVLVWGAIGTGIGLGLYERWVDATRRSAVETARQTERLDLARELHDVVAHHVTGIVVQAQAALLVADDRPEAAVEALRSIEVAGGEALGSMRAMVGSLRGDEHATTAPAASVADIGGLVAQAQAAGHPVAWSVDLAPGTDLPDAVSGAAFRIVQESLSNVRRHAGPSASVVVRVAGADDVVEVSVLDDGAATRPRRSGVGGFGLVGMAERVAALGGRLEAGPVADGPAGWRVRAWLPMEPGGLP